MYLNVQIHYISGTQEQET